MRGLLLKDYYTLLKQSKIFVVIIVIFALTPENFLSGFAMVYAAMLPFTALAYDERSKWDSLAVMMPYSAGALVLSKYILGYAGVFGACVVSTGARLVMSLLGRAEFTAEAAAFLLVWGCLALMVLALNLPFMFRLGVERGRIVFFVLVGGITLLGVLLGDELSVRLAALPTSPGALVALAAGAAIAINAISILVSMGVCRRKNA